MTSHQSLPSPLGAAALPDAAPPDVAPPDAAADVAVVPPLLVDPPPHADSTSATALTPTIVAVSVPRVETKIPFSELVAATCAAVQNILLAAHALGLGAIWKTGPAATDPNVKAKLGIDPADEVVGFVYLGQPAEPPAPRHPTTEGVVAVWSP